MADAQRPKDPRRWWKVATGFWFAVQRMDQPASDDPDGDDDDDEAGSGIPRRPAPTSGSAGAEAEPDDDAEDADLSDAEPRGMSQRG